MNKAVLFLFVILLLSCGRRNVLGPLVEFHEVGARATLGYAQDVKVVDSLAYLATGQGCLEIISVSDPENPFDRWLRFFLRFLLIKISPIKVTISAVTLRLFLQQKS